MLLDTSRAILLWDFDDAPAELRALSKHGGDEDGVAILPAGMSAAPFWLERLWERADGPPYCQEVRTSDGALVFIWAHA